MCEPNILGEKEAEEKQWLKRHGDYAEKDVHVDPDERKFVLMYTPFTKLQTEKVYLGAVEQMRKYYKNEKGKWVK